MLRIRLSRTGKKNEPHFRVVVAEQRAPAQGKFIESLGFYNPKKKVFKIDEEKMKLWLSRGAKPSPTVHNKLVDLGIIKEPKIKASKKKKVASSATRRRGGKEKKPAQTAELSAGKKEEKKKEEKIKKEEKKEQKS